MSPSPKALLFLIPVLATAQTMRDRVKPLLERALANGESFVTVSAASGMPGIAPGSLASIFGSNLASQGQTVTVQITDSKGTTEMAKLLYVSPEQINYVVPEDMATGSATVRVVNGSTTLSAGAQIQQVASALFTANDNGQGVVAATAYRTLLTTTITSPVPVFICLDAPGSCRSVPIDPGLDTPVTVTLYATGIRNRSSDSAVKLTVGGMDIPIRSVTSITSGALEGVDEVTFGLPLSLRGAGEVDVILKVDGVVSNAGRINIQ